MTAKTTTTPATTTVETDEEFMAPVRDVTPPEVRAILDTPAPEAPKTTGTRKPRTSRAKTTGQTNTEKKTSKETTMKKDTAKKAGVVTELIWEEPPVAQTEKKKADWEVVRDQLEANPGKWARVAEGNKYPNAATTWRKRGCEARNAKQEDGTFTTWARFPHPAEEAGAVESPAS